MSIEADRAAEGEPDAEFTPGIASRLQGKWMSSAALFRDPQGRLMLLDQPYRPTWGLPGGMIEADESPLQGVRREIEEELGVALPVGPLLVVDWLPRHGVWQDSVQFLFDGGVLTPGDVAAFRLQASEISAVHFLPFEEITPPLVRPSLQRRLAAALTALETGRTGVLHFGRRQ